MYACVLASSCSAWTHACAARAVQIVVVRVHIVACVCVCVLGCVTCSVSMLAFCYVSGVHARLVDM